jgi:hypothetical protein
LGGGGRLSGFGIVREGCGRLAGVEGCLELLVLEELDDGEGDGDGSDGDGGGEVESGHGEGGGEGVEGCGDWCRR